MDVCADHFLPGMFKPSPAKNTNRRKKLKGNAVPEPPKYLLKNKEEKEDIQERQLVKLMRKEERQDEKDEDYYQQQQANVVYWCKDNKFF